VVKSFIKCIIGGSLQYLKQVIIKSPAKINLHLDIKERRSDGYHSIISIFQMISLFDIITVSTLKTKNTYRLEGNFQFPVSENIITKAVKQFRLTAGINTGIAIEVEKNIPQGAGLGGGSSNAAYTLKALNMLHENTLSQEDLLHLALSLGSDVKFFLSAPTAIVTGRGEKIEAITMDHRLLIILVKPGFSVNTKEAYSWFDQNNLNKKTRVSYSIEELKFILNKVPIEKWNFYNSFYDILVKQYPILDSIKRELKVSGVIFTGLSGSGATLFGIVKRKKKAELIVNKLKNKFPFVTIVEAPTSVPQVEWD